MSLSPFATRYTSKRPPGRPKKADAPNVPWDIVDKALVHGEQQTDPHTGETKRVYPSMGELGERYGVSRNRVWQWASKKKCLERRKEVEFRERYRYDAKVADKRAEARALGTEDVVGIVDAFLLRFAELLYGGGVRADSPADFDRLVRLKELLRGNADSRQAIQGSFTLEAIQQRHQLLRVQMDTLNPAVAGVESPSKPEPEEAATAGTMLPASQTEEATAGSMLPASQPERP